MAISLPFELKTVSASGTLTHGAAFTVTGSGFGTKSTAAPALWTDCTGTMANDWDGNWPNTTPASSTEYLQYRAVNYRSVSGPHARATHYMVGAVSGTSYSPQGGSGVMASLYRASHANGDIVYARWYYRNDPNWSFDVDEADRNHKHFAINFGGSGPYESQYWYIDANQTTYDDAVVDMQVKYSPAPGHALITPDANGHSIWWDACTNPCSAWVLFEVEVKLAQDNTGYIKMWADGVLIMDYLGPTRDNPADAGMSVLLGGYDSCYVNDPRSTNFRYFADCYIDWTPARVIFGDATTLAASVKREVQIPTSWSTTSIGVTGNCGKFTSGQTGYMHVVDSTGAVQNNVMGAITVA